MAKSVLDIVIRMTKQGGADKETIKELVSMKGAITNVMGVMGGLAAVGATVMTVYKNTAQVFLNYATQVRDMSRVTGLGAEQTSKLIQAADDLTISYESLQKALWAASKQGIDVSIDSLARMADEYMALGSASEQAEYLAKKFGKSGAEMGKLMEKGADGVRKYTDAISGNLVLTDQAVASATLWKMQMDAFNDQVEAAKVSMGAGLVGVLNGSTVEIQKQAQAIFELNNGYTFNTNQMGRYTDAQRAAWEEAKNLATEQWMVANGLKESGDAAGDNALQMQEAAEAAKKLSDEQKQLMDVAFQLQDVQDDYNKNLEDLTAQQSAATAEWNNANQQYKQGKIGIDDLNQANIDYQTTMQETGLEIQKLASEHEIAMNRIVFSIIQAQVAADGLQEGEGKALLGIAVKLGLLDQNTADMAGSMIDSFSGITDAAELSKKEVSDFNEDIWIAKNSQGTFYYNFIMTTSGEIPGLAALGGLGGGAAGGGGHNKNIRGKGGGLTESWAGGYLGSGWTLVGDAPGGGMTNYSELISPSGYVFSNDQTKALIAAGLVPEMRKRAGDVDGLVFNPEPSTTVRRTGIGGTTTVPRVRQDSLAGMQTSDQISAASAQSQAALETASSTNMMTGAAVTEMTSITTTAFTSMTESNNSLLAEIKGLRQDMRRQQDTTVRAIRENLQQVLT